MATVQTKSSETLEEKFQRLASTWQKAVAHLSSSSKRETHPAYKEIISLGSYHVSVSKKGDQLRLSAHRLDTV